MPNRLAREPSAYLRQHAENPVDWFPWGSEALDLARQEDRPILLSVGYSSCHWCHVMERESFEDPVVADLMNGLFVNIKVDREERPDVDQIYMKAVQAMTGSGGWPMTVFLTPDGVPYYGGTYFPPEPRHGLPSFSQVLRAAAEAYQNRRDQVRESGQHLVDALARAAERQGGESVDGHLLEGAYHALANRYDAVHGGFGSAPKFPQPVTLELLLRWHMRSGEAAPLDLVVHTLRRMAAGGLRDHLGGGFHRYSVDARWLVPHFEKMLYDNALLARVYLDAYRVTGERDFRRVAEQTLDYLVADMRAPDGGFCAARDADSEGEEGRFYVWSAEEVEDVLGTQEAPLFSRVYGVTPSGNFEGLNILHLPHDVAAVAAAEGIASEELEARLQVAREALLGRRRTREPPFRDEKVVVSWNAMAVRAFAEAGATLGRPDYLAVATETADFLWTRLRPAGDRLMHTYMEGEPKVAAFLDDHAGLGNALLSLHGATLDIRWLDPVRELCEEILKRFVDDATGAAYDTPDDGETLVLRPRDAMDQATPSGASMAAELLTRAGHVFDEERFRVAARRILESEAEPMSRFGPAYGRMLSVLDRMLSAPVEVAIVGPESDERTRELTRAAHRPFIPNGTLVGRDPDHTVEGVPLLAEDRGMSGGDPAAYVCRRYECRLPVTGPEALFAAVSEEI